MLGLRLDEPLPLDGPRAAPSTRASSTRLAAARARRARARRRSGADPARPLPRRRRHRPPARLTASYHDLSPDAIGAWDDILLSERQRDILRRVVEEYVATGQPVGSKTLVERAGLGVSPSTVRNELAELERLGLLYASAHLGRPHPDRGGLPPLRRRAARPAGAALDRVPARPSSPRRGGRGGAAVDDRDAVAGDAAAGARLGAAAPGRDRAARRRCCCSSRTSSWSS